MLSDVIRRKSNLSGITELFHRMLTSCGTDFIISAVLLLATGCADIEHPGTGTGEDMPDLELFSANVRYNRGETTLFVIEAPHISRLEKEQIMLLDGGIKVDFFDNNGLHNAVLTSDEGVVREKTNMLTARGNVIVESDSGLVLLADELHYEQDINRVLSDGFVTVITSNDSISGKGFSAAPDLSDWVIIDPSGSTWRKTE